VQELTASQVLDFIGATRGSVLYRGSAGWSALTPGSSGTVLTSGGVGSDPSFAAAAGAGLVSIVKYTTSQTITIPTGATKARVRLVGGGASGAGKTSVDGNGGAGGAAGALEKYLSGLTAGNTLVLTIGAGGAAVSGYTNGNNGGNTTLASGTQTITTLTANGGGGGQRGGCCASSGGTGTQGSASNGDVNMQSDFGGRVAPLFSAQNAGYGAGGSGVLYPSTGASTAGTAGVCVIEWYA
jgi:hypothetical protein